MIGPEPTGEHLDVQLDVRDTSVWDERKSPIVSPIDMSEEREALQPLSPSSTRPPFPLSPFPTTPKVSSVVTRPKRKSVVNRAWNKFKKLFMKKFETGEQGQPNLSDSLVPERDDEPKWYDALFSKPLSPPSRRDKRASR